MSICYGVRCLDCKAAAPVEWSGYFGAPSLSTDRVPTGRYQVLPFGYLYAPFLALGIRPYELEAFRAFLLEHEGHRLCQFSDADSEVPTELSNILAKEDSVRNIRAELDQAKRARAESLAHGTYTFGRYAVQCPSCGVQFMSAEPECLLSRPREPLIPAAIALYLSLAPELDPEDCSRPPYHVDCVEGFVESLEAFLKEHRSHGVEAWVEPEAARA